VKKIELKSVPAARGMSTGVRIPRGQTLLQIGTAGTVWRVLTGAFRLERLTGGGQTVVHLALAGDLVGVEALCAEPYACTVTALVDSVATPEPMVGESALSHERHIQLRFRQIRPRF
jgi:CRP-like cAMP-binding protein